MSNTFFTSDQHFFHANIIKYCNRPFENIAEMNEAMVTRWNSVVGPEDVVYQLGDFFLSSRHGEVSNILDSLNFKHLFFIKGNHDRSFLDFYKKNRDRYDGRISVLGDRKTVNIDRQKIVLCHYPLAESWNNTRKNMWHLFGHRHGTSQHVDYNSMDVGVDCHDFYPLSIPDIRAKLNCH